MVLAHSFIPHSHTHENNADHVSLDEDTHDWLNWLDLHHEDLGEGHLEDYLAQNIHDYQLDQIFVSVPIWGVSESFNPKADEYWQSSLFLNVFYPIEEYIQSELLLRGPPFC